MNTNTHVSKDCKNNNKGEPRKKQKKRWVTNTDLEDVDVVEPDRIIRTPKDNQLVSSSRPGVVTPSSGSLALDFDSGPSEGLWKKKNNVDNKIRRRFIKRDHRLVSKE